MLVLVRRIARRQTYTIGHLYVDGKYVCDTIEDKDRGLSSGLSFEENISRKIKDETAIPSGVYKLDMDTVSPRFKDRAWAKPYGGKVPRLRSVPAFEGVLIHPGTDENSTSGCIIVGENRVVGKVVNSQATFHRLMKDHFLKAKDKGETIYIQIW